MQVELSEQQMKPEQCANFTGRRVLESESMPTWSAGPEPRRKDCVREAREDVQTSSASSARRQISGKK